jgi:anaerobic C4-dicarboxylate transporter
MYRASIVLLMFAFLIFIGIGIGGLLISLALSMGSIAAVRITNLFLDGQPDFNIPALIMEALFAAAALKVARRREASTT